MNNGQPPYGDPSAWGQQGQQVNPAQYPVQPNPYAQQGGYGVPQGYAQPMQPVQPYQQSYTQPQTYQQQTHPQQQVYQQQSWQPYQQPYPQQPYQQTGPQPQQFYGQNQAAQQPYPQFNQMGQQVHQGYGAGYSGYYSQPQQKKFEIPFDVVAKVVLFGVLPVLFVLAMILGAAPLKWVFLGGAVAGIVLMWMRDVVTPNMRLTMSLVLGVMAVVALVGALGGAPAAEEQPSLSADNQTTQQQTSNDLTSQQTTAVPQDEATPTPTPEDEADSAQEQLMSFFYFWSVGNDEAMLSLTAPSWRNSVENPQQALFVLLLNRTPQDDYEITNITGTDNDVLRTATVKVTIDKNDGRTTMDRYAFKVLLKKEDGFWYVDPQSLESNEKETATETAASANETPTQPPLYTGHPDTVLYYNPDGGTRYHLDPDCSEVGDRYKPMASFLFAELDQAPYNELYACGPCGAPIPDD